MARIGGVAEALDHPERSWGFGKIHGQMVTTADGAVWFATYWGTRRGIEFDDAYRGDVLFRLDPQTLKIDPVSVPVPGHGIPSLTGDGRRLFGEAVDPGTDPLGGGLFVFDTWTGEVTAWVRDDRHTRFRNIVIDGLAAMVAGRDGGLLRWEPGADRLVATTIDLGDQLRASTRPSANGTVHAVTSREHRLVAINADGEVTGLGVAPAYTTSLALSADESTVYLVPGAHGSVPELNAPLVALDTETGTQTVLVELAGPIHDALGLHLGGSYNVALDERRGLVHIGFNAGVEPEDRWGEVVQVTVDLGGPHSAGPVDPAEVNLVDATAALGALEPLLGIRGHAVAVGDVNSDGWQDLFVGTFADRPAGTYAARGADGPAPDRLLLGGPDGFAMDESFPGRLARSAGAVFADLDADGDPDLVVSRNVRRGETGTEIYRNDDGRLVAAGILDADRGGRAIGALDFDGDGLVDLYLVEDRWSGASSVLYRNEGGLGFSDVTTEAGLATDVWGLGLGIADLDLSGTLDLVIGGSNRVFLGDGVGGFVESSGLIWEWETFGAEDDVAHVAIDDVDRDGRPDLVLGQHYNSTIDFGETVPVRLYLNRTEAPGAPEFVDATDAAGLVGLATKSPKVLLVDIDDNGWLDIVTTASTGSGSEPAILLNRGLVNGAVGFTPPTGLGDQQYWIDAALIDVDRDGDQDLFLVEWEPSLGSVVLRNGS